MMLGSTPARNPRSGSRLRRCSVRCGRRNRSRAAVAGRGPHIDAERGGRARARSRRRPAARGLLAPCGRGPRRAAGGRFCAEAPFPRSAYEFLDRKGKRLQTEKEQWQNTFDTETKELDDKLQKLKDDRERAQTELEAMEDQRAKEAEEYRAKENEMRVAVLVEKQRRGQLERMHAAVLFLQEEGRRYMERVRARKDAAKGKKKKGKKK
ncbi:unnamed protein product [Prorocentrum cordatum]|uniref:Dynein regulatory complex protein 10 n=1 Tax=Prorocentrum cordatum TaxID=2364126 RepID=A0ABN9YHY2_9DINO|nr:unnamed protein product [Polarella glacialis]